jgi:hypothetical protein
MSMSLIIATPHEVYISADTALSHVAADGKVYRLSLQGKPLPVDKIYMIDGATLFISGIVASVEVQQILCDRIPKPVIKRLLPTWTKTHVAGRI